MDYSKKLNPELLAMFPDIPPRHLWMIVSAHIQVLGNVCKRSKIVRYRSPHLGTFKTHGNTKMAIKTGKRKKKLYKRLKKNELLKKEYLLF